MILVIVFGLAWLIYAIVIASHMNSYYSGISDKVSASKNKLDSIINAQTETDVAINNTLDTEIKNIMSNPNLTPEEIDAKVEELNKKVGSFKKFKDTMAELENQESAKEKKERNDAVSIIIIVILSVLVLVFIILYIWFKVKKTKVQLLSSKDKLQTYQGAERASAIDTHNELNMFRQDARNAYRQQRR